MTETSSKEHGLFRLYPRKYRAEQCAVDIVAIHGLGGNAFKTWTDSEGHLWLRDSLPKHVPRTRIMTYGYDSAVAFGRSRMNVGDFAVDLLTRLVMVRECDAERMRPLVFICHSLGGVVLKQALITASAVQNHYGAITKSTFGVIFMGTPHRGSRVATPARHIARIINATSLSSLVRSDLLAVLSMSSKELQDISQLSVPILKNLVIVSFYEQKPLGPTLIVEPVSAILGLPNERAIPVNTDHRKMAKVSPKHKQMYMPVWKGVSDLVEAAINENASQLRELLDVLYSVDYKQSQLAIRQPHRGTCDWLFNHGVFNNWALAKGSSMLWLVGSPGVGKSVITRHLVEGVLGGNDRTILPYDYIGASFFCSYKESASITECDILRSLLHQFLQAYPQCQDTVRRRLDIKLLNQQTERFQNWNLWRTIEDVLTLQGMQYCFICLDALEELPFETLHSLLEGFYRIVIRFSHSQPSHYLRVFVSSRPIPNLQRSLRAVHTIRIQPSDISPQIKRFLQDGVRDFAQQHKSFAHATNQSLRDKVACKIEERADGMFLWASIAWEDFKKGLLWNHDIVDEKLKQLESTSSGINSLYDRVIGKVDLAIRPDMWLIFESIALTGRSLSETELGVMLAVRRSQDHVAYSHQIHPFEALDEIIEENFPELVKIHDDGQISFTHLSFKEYLFQYWDETNPCRLRTARRELADACLTYLTLKDLVNDADSTDWLEIQKKYTLFQYAYNFHIYHLKFISNDNPLWLRYASLASQKSLFTVNWTGKKYWSPLRTVTDYVRSAPLVKKFVEYGYDVNEPWRSDHEHSALEYCCDERTGIDQEEFVATLLDAGANPNGLHYAMGVGETCLQHMIRTRAWRLYAMLLKCPRINLGLCNYRGQTVIHYMVQFGDCARLADILHMDGFDINAQDTGGNTALHDATTHSDIGKLKLLLEVNGVQLDIQDSQGRTPLTLASYWGLRKAALMLISCSRGLPTLENNEMSSIICAAMQDDECLTQILLEKFEFCNLDHHLDVSGRTVLHHAAINDWPRIIEQVLHHTSGVEILNRIDHSGGSALHHAAALGHTRCVQVLLERGASVHLQDRNGRTAAHAAADSGFKDTLVILLGAEDIDPCQRDHQGRNLVHWAASIDCVDVMEMIVRQWPHVELTRKDNLFQLPIDIANICKCANVGKFLEEEMERRGLIPSWLQAYNWGSMYNSPLLDVVPEEDLSAIDREARKAFELAEQKERNRVWEALHEQYPDVDWALTIRGFHCMAFEISIARTELAELYSQLDSICLAGAHFPSARKCLDSLARPLDRLQDIIDSRDSNPVSTKGSWEQSQLDGIRAMTEVMRTMMDVVNLESDTDTALDESFMELSELYNELARAYRATKEPPAQIRWDAMDKLRMIRVELINMGLTGLSI